MTGLARMLTADVLSDIISELRAIESDQWTPAAATSTQLTAGYIRSSFPLASQSFCQIKNDVLLVSPPGLLLSLGLTCSLWSNGQYKVLGKLFCTTVEPGTQRSSPWAAAQQSSGLLFCWLQAFGKQTYQNSNKVFKILKAAFFVTCKKLFSWKKLKSSERLQ